MYMYSSHFPTPSSISSLSAWIEPLREQVDKEWGALAFPSLTRSISLTFSSHSHHICLLSQLSPP
uniref:Uncharacterized protein n=1 Tax=Rhizophora mucronata TaxID=61149 RepID=A0A2P2N361_RHIMU